MNLKKLIKSILRSFGIELVKVQGADGQVDWFRFDDSCQIPYLSNLYSQIFGTETVGTLVEVGAFDGITFSNSSGLIERGWSAVLIEPIPEFAQNCKRRYKNNPKIRIIEKAISNKTGYSVINLSGPLSSMNSSLQMEYSKLDWSRNALTDEMVTVPTTTLNELLLSEGLPKGFELLIVDVEGFENEVFQGLNLENWKPKAIIVELSDFHPSLNSGRQAHFELSIHIQNFGYSIVYKDSINTIFVESSLLSSLFLQKNPADPT